MTQAVQAGQSVLCEGYCLCLSSSASLHSLQPEGGEDTEKKEVISHEEMLQVWSVLLCLF